MAVAKDPWIILAIVVATSLGVATACRESTPSAPSERISIAISPSPDVLLVGESVTLTTTDRATGQSVAARWSTTDSSVASVVGGILNARTPGVATIVATYKDSTASFIVKIVPRFAGHYL